MNEVILTGGGRTEVSRKGPIVLRQTGAWSASVRALLRHLESEGFAGAPRIAGSGLDEMGRETLTYIEGEIIHPFPWRDEAIIAIGSLLRQMHNATSNFTPPIDALWRPWFGRKLRYSTPIIGHCDFAPWNLISNNGVPFAVIDWETAGPVDALVELAQVCWLNVQLCDDDVAERVGLGSITHRAEQLRLLVDAYELPLADRTGLVDIMIRVAVLDAADQAIEAKITPDTKESDQLWGLAWRTRAAAWMVNNYKILESALI